MLLYRTLDAVMPRFRRIFREHGITEQQWRVLRVLWDLDRASLGELAASTLIPAPSLVGVIDRLAARGLVDRQRSVEDRRSVQISATRKGRRLLEKLLPSIATAYAELKLPVDPSTWEQVVNGLDEICRRQS